MAGLASSRIGSIDSLVTLIPVGIVDVMKAVRTVCGESRSIRMAGLALDDRAGVALELNGRNVVICVRVAYRPLGMGAPVAGFTRHPAVAKAVSIQGIIFFGKPLVRCHGGSGCRVGRVIGGGLPDGASEVTHRVSSMAGLALGFIQPGGPLRVGSPDSKQSPVTLLTDNPSIPHCTA